MSCPTASHHIYLFDICCLMLRWMQGRELSLKVLVNTIVPRRLISIFRRSAEPLKHMLVGTKKVMIFGRAHTYAAYEASTN